MCDRDPSQATGGLLQASLAEVFPRGRRLPDLPIEPQSSRRLKLWELPSNTHCPLIGVCLPMPMLRKLITKTLHSKPTADDYEFHVAAVSECGRRRPIAEALQRELDRRYAQILRQFSQAKTTEALSVLWSEALRSANVGGALWATLTHPRCDEDMREKVCRDIHMFQHQVGACNRADLHRLDVLQEENQSHARDMAALKERHAKSLARRDSHVEALSAELLRTRGQVMARESTIASLHEELAALKASIPDLSARMDLARRVELQRHRIYELERHRTTSQRQTEQAEERIEHMARELASLREQLAKKEIAQDVVIPEEQLVAKLRDKAVLCVGGRPASVPTYRQVIECTGGKFLHHDGGEENNTAQLDASLAAADLVICQTGCISHGAYWRVKDHCKRTGKRCVFVDKPSTSSLVRCLRGLGDETTTVGEEETLK